MVDERTKTIAFKGSEGLHFKATLLAKLEKKSLNDFLNAGVEEYVNERWSRPEVRRQANERLAELRRTANAQSDVLAELVEPDEETSPSKKPAPKRGKK